MGIIGPPQTPSATRKAISMPSEVAMPHSVEKTPKPEMQTTNTLTGPNRSASQPVSGTMIASATP